MRFPEFTDEWTETNIGSILSIGNGKDYKDLGDGNIPVFGTGGYMTSVKDYLMDGESVFIGRKGTINKPSYYKGKFWTVDTLFYTHEFIGAVPRFVLYLFENIDWLKYNEASGVPSLSKSTIEKIKINIPKTIEQKKISAFISLLDRRIEVQSGLINKLESLIGGIGQRVFSQFNSFVKLGNVAKITNGNSDVQDAIEIYESGLYPFYDRSDVIKYLNTYYLDKEAIIYAGEGSEFFPRYHNGKFALHQRCYAIFDFKEEYLTKFIYYYMFTLNGYFVRNSVGSTVPSLRMGTFEKVNIPKVPVKQQLYIIKVFDCLHKKLHQAKQTKRLFEMQKQYLLQQMFI